MLKSAWHNSSLQVITDCYSINTISLILVCYCTWWFPSNILCYYSQILKLTQARSSSSSSSISLRFMTPLLWFEVDACAEVLHFFEFDPQLWNKVACFPLLMFLQFKALHYIQWDNAPQNRTVHTHTR